MIAPIFIMVVTAVIIAAVQARILQKETRSMGILSALGYRKGELYRQYLGIPAFLTIVGALLGLVVRGLTIAPLAELLTEECNTPPFAAVISPMDVLLPLLVPLLLVLALCARSISRVLGLNIPFYSKGNFRRGQPIASTARRVSCRPARDRQCGLEHGALRPSMVRGEGSAVGVVRWAGRRFLVGYPPAYCGTRFPLDCGSLGLRQLATSTL